jgi:fatty acid/phospholipid biosynthesis enzyme
VIGDLLNNLKTIPDLKMEMSKIEDAAAYKARGITLAFDLKVQELMDKNKMIQKEQEKKEKELNSYAQEMIVLRRENAELKAEHLVQFAELGYIYAQSVMEIPNPTVGLMNLGEEEGKGSAILQSVYQSLKTHPFINFIGNLEGRDVFTSKADVIITDGLVGNVILKLAESVYELLMAGNTPLDSFFTKLNYELHGGSPIVGVNGNVVIGHGRSTPLAIKNMVAQCRRMIRADVNQKISKAIESMANPPQN